MPSPRSKRRDDAVDAIRTINWFRCIGDELETYVPRDIQRFLEPGKSGLDLNGDYIRNNQYLEYSKGLHVPRASLVARADLLVEGSSWELNHVLWSVLRRKTAIHGHEHKWLRELVPDIQTLVFESNNAIRLKGGRHYLGALERRASMDSLTALTILLRMNHERQDSEQVWECAKSIFRVLLIVGNQLNERQIATRLFELYTERVFSLAKQDGCRIYVETCNYPMLSRILYELSEHLRYKTSHARDRKLQSFYAMQILNGERKLGMREFFQPLIGPDLDIGPPTEEGLCQLKTMNQ